jgi:hypothetical protein
MTRTRRVVVVVMLMCVAVAVVVLDWPKDVEQEPDTVHRLRYTSVVVAAGAEDLLDVERSRRIVGDRPVVVIAGDVGVTCDDVRDWLPELIVLVVSADPPLNDCGGRESRWEPDLLRELRDVVVDPDAGRDQTAYVVAYVRAFDARVEPGTSPPRREPPQPGQDGDAIQLVVLVVMITAVFLLVVGYLVRQVRAEARSAGLLRRSWRASTNARLNQLADRIMRVDDPGRTPAERAAVAKGYVLALRDFEYATTDEERGSVNQQLRMLERRAGITAKRPMATKSTEATKPTKARSWAAERRKARARRVELRQAMAKDRREQAERHADPQRHAEQQVAEARQAAKRWREAKERRQRRNKRGRKS